MINPSDIKTLKQFAINYENTIENIEWYRQNIDLVHKSGIQNITIMCPTTGEPQAVLTLSKEKCIDLLREEISRLEEKQRSMTLEGLFRDVAMAYREGQSNE